MKTMLKRFMRLNAGKRVLIMAASVFVTLAVVIAGVGGMD